MIILDAYASQSEERLLSGGHPVMVITPQSDCGLQCAYCYLQHAQPIGDWSPTRLADWVLTGGHPALEWCGWPPLNEARSVYRLLNGRATVILKTSGMDARRTAEILCPGAPICDVYVPDLKFADPAVAGLLCGTTAYPESNQATLQIMSRGFGRQSYDRNGRLTRGVLARHLMLPGFLQDTLQVIDAFAPYAQENGWPLSLVDAYMPPPSGAILPDPSLRGTLNADDYEIAKTHAESQRICLA